MHDEVEQIQRAKKGDLQAFQALVQNHSGKVYSLAYRILLNKECAEDCSQEVFIKVFQKLSNFQHQSSFSTWLYSIAANTAIDIQRKQSKHAVTDEQDLDAFTNPREHGPETLYWVAQINRLSAKAINQLPPEVRVAFVLRHYQGCSIEDISQIQNQNPNTVKHRIFRGVKRLREILASKVEVE